MSFGSLIVAVGAVAAGKSRLCFKAAAKSERQHRRDFARSERRIVLRLSAKRIGDWPRKHMPAGHGFDMLTGCMDGCGK